MRFSETVNILISIGKRSHDNYIAIVKSRKIKKDAAISASGILKKDSLFIYQLPNIRL